MARRFTKAILRALLREPSCPSWLALLPRPRPARHNCRGDPAARTKLSSNLRPHRLHPLHHILEHLIDHVLLKNPKIAVGLQILLQGFQLKAILVRHVTDVQHSKIRQPGFRTHRRELRIVDNDLVSRKLVRPSLDLGKPCIKTGGGMLRCVSRRRTTGRFCHALL